MIYLTTLISADMLKVHKNKPSLLSDFKNLCVGLASGNRLLLALRNYLLASISVAPKRINYCGFVPC